MLLKKTVLLVEDEEITAFLSKKILAKNDYLVVHATTGEEAVEIALSNDSIDLILMDIDLGAGIDGTEASQKILAKKDIPLVFMSSHTEKEVVEKTEGITSYGYIVKNTGETVLRASLKMAFKLFDQKMLVAQKEKALIEREQLFSAFMDNIPLMAIIKDENRRPVYYNSKFMDRFPHDAQLGIATDELLTGKQKLKILESDNLAIENGLYQYEETLIDEFGKKAYLEIYKFLIQRHGVSNQLGVLIHDITEKKEALLAHAQTTEQLQASLSNTPNVAVQWYKEDGTLIYWNKASESMYGFSEREAIGKTLDELIYNKEEQKAFLEIIQSIKKTGKPFGPFESEIIHKDGSKGWVLATTFSIPLTENTLGYVCMDVDITSLKETQKDLLIKESAIANSLHALAISDLEGKIIYINQRFLSLFDYSSNEDVIGKYLSLFLKNTDDLLPIKETLEEVGLWSGNLAVKRKDESTFMASVAANIINDEHGKPSYYLTYASDISNKIELEQKIATNQNMLQLVFDVIPQAFFKKDKNGVFLDCNTSFINQLGLESKEDVLGKTDYQILSSKNDSNYFSQIDQEIIKSGQSRIRYEEKFTQADGSISWLETSKIPLFDENGEVSSIIGIFDNITDWKLRNEEVKQKEQLYRSMFEVNTAIKLLIDPISGQIIDANKAAIQFYGYSKDDLLKLKISDINILNENEVKSEMDLAQFEKRFNFKFRHKIANGEIRDVDVYSGPIDVNGEKYLHSIVFDITARNQAEKQVSELLIQKDNILKEVHHRVKNNMGTIFNLLTIQSNLTEDEKAKDILIDAASRTQSMMILYDKLYRSDNFRTLNIKDYLPDLIKDITQVFHPIRDIETSITIDSIEMHTKMLSPVGIIINELITNSIKYAFKEIANPKIAITLTSNDSKMAILTYTDNGKGIPDSIHFNQSSGFGMQLIGMLIRQLHGKGEIIRGENSMIRIEFPLD